MRPFGVPDVYPSEAEAEVLSNEMPFRDILAMAVEEGTYDASRPPVKRLRKRFRRIGPYQSQQNATTQIGYVRRRYEKGLPGKFEMYSRVHSDGVRGWIEVRFAHESDTVWPWPPPEGRGGTHEQ